MFFNSIEELLSDFLSDSAAHKLKCDCGALILFWMNVSYLLESISVHLICLVHYFQYVIFEGS